MEVVLLGVRSRMSADKVSTAFCLVLRGGPRAVQLSLHDWRRPAKNMVEGFPSDYPARLTHIFEDISF